MAKRFYFTNENGDNIANDHIGNIRGARTKAKQLANELGQEVCINDCETDDMLDWAYPDKRSEETAEQEVETATEKTEQVEVKVPTQGCFKYIVCKEHGRTKAYAVKKDTALIPIAVKKWERQNSGQAP